MALAEKILKALDSRGNNQEKLEAIKVLAVDEIRLQALKATPNFKTAKVLSAIYKNMGKEREIFNGYIPLDNGFALTDSYFLVNVFNEDPSKVLPASANKIEKPTEQSIKNLIKSVKSSERHGLTVRYSDVLSHIKTHGRKRCIECEFFTVRETEYCTNVFYMEYAFKLLGTTEITFQVLDANVPSPWYFKNDKFQMLICPMRGQQNRKKGAI